MCHTSAHYTECIMYKLLLLYPFNNLFSRITWVSQHQKGKPFWILLEQEMMGCQWHQLDHMQIICTSLQTDNHASTSPLSFYRASYAKRGTSCRRVSVRLSVCPSVTSRYCIETATHRITQTTPYGSPGNLVF